ncbi:hypothetical protein AVEN_265277-1 [Araneus ventricosus]|uniref:Uncharacterized protein n=1 Tax=Araneus ventricosus TaxID=182803 RepID=A0A4Y2P154_ARAVE|nr:hypothetical protein AVEN_265277-1 [Araneus ventricosus]
MPQIKVRFEKSLTQQQLSCVPITSNQNNRTYSGSSLFLKQTNSLLLHIIHTGIPSNMISNKHSASYVPGMAIEHTSCGWLHRTLCLSTYSFGGCVSFGFSHGQSYFNSRAIYRKGESSSKERLLDRCRVSYHPILEP